MLIQRFIEKNFPIHFPCKYLKMGPSYKFVKRLPKSSCTACTRVFIFLYFCPDTDLKLNQIGESFTQWLHWVTYVKITSNPFPWPGLEPTMMSMDDFSTMLTTFTELLKSWALCTNVCLAYSAHNPADTFAVCLSRKHRGAFQQSNLQDRFDAGPCGKAWFPLSFEWFLLVFEQRHVSF